MNYDLSTKAADDILHLYVEGVRDFGVAQAEKYYAGLERSLLFLGDNPQGARERMEIDPPVRVHPYGVHVIIYVINEQGRTYILRVRKSSEDWDKAPV